MTVFKDEDDGAAYLIYASARNKEMHISRLSEDYTDVENVTVRALIGMHGEAPAVFKHGGAAQAEGDRSVEGDGLAVAAKHMADGPRVGAECKADMPSANQAGRGMERVVPNRRAATLAVGPSRSGVGFEPVVAVEATRAGTHKWNPANLRDSGYLWLPLTVKAKFERYGPFPLWSKVAIFWHERWRASIKDNGETYYVSKPFSAGDDL
ncbi:hypothetical protein SASPL_157149 [Salvia splendens]|uniref:Uncharacterized protein n=1 Tax=Salvia splendens TaxID=180675 RepID=A0A8X8YUP2_SALSN|nr:hypothetical protein SASPL_157149 [Salvia splendens]